MRWRDTSAATTCNYLEPGRKHDLHFLHYPMLLRYHFNKHQYQYIEHINQHHNDNNDDDDHHYLVLMGKQA